MRLLSLSCYFTEKAIVSPMKDTMAFGIYQPAMSSFLSADISNTSGTASAAMSAA